jgi:arginine:ornithine antiporter/lysine permease
MKDDKLSLTELVGLVIGSIIGGGIFNLMRDMATPASAGSIIVGWVITAVGMVMLALCFQNLNMKRPDLDAGIYSYAEAGFGKYMGFNSAWGYWISAWLGNVGYATLLMSAVGYFMPVFKDGQNIYSIIVASLILWGCHFLILQGTKSASFINTVLTIAKLIPIGIFLVVMFISFKIGIFTTDFWGTVSNHFELKPVLSQVKGTMLVTVWVFIGIEGAVLFSGKAKKRSDVGKATILGIITVILIYMLVTLLSLGVMTRPELANLRQPAMAYLLQSIVGKWGAVLVNLGLIISVAGAWLSWTMFAGQLPYEAAKNGTFPKFFAKENQHHAPVNSLLLTNILIQIFFFTYLISSSAYNFFYSLASSAILIPYAFSGFYQLKYSLKEDKATAGRKINIIIGIVASIYACWLVYAAGMKYLLLTTLLFAPGIAFFYVMQKNDNHQTQVFTHKELIIAGLIIVCAIWSLYLIFLGKITF